MDILNQFGVQPILLAAQIVNFLLLLFILKRFLYKPILKVLEERKTKIEAGLKNAEEIEKRLNEITEKEAEVLLRAGKESEKMIKEAGAEYIRIIEEAKKEHERIMSKALEDAKGLILVEETRLKQQVRESLGDMVTLIFEKVIDKKITKEDQKNIIEKEVRNLS